MSCYLAEKVTNFTIVKPLFAIACFLTSMIATLGQDQDEAKTPRNFSRTQFEVAGHHAFVITPPKDKILSGTPIPWVFYAPTFANQLPSDRDEGWMMERWLDKGIAIAGIDVGESYGSPTGRKLYNALHEALVTQHGFDEKACLLARSRGGLMLYCWAVENPQKVRCITAIYPVCDLTSYPGIQKASPAYGMTPDELEAQLEQHNPIPRLAPLAQARVPIFHIHGDQDKLVPFDANSNALAKAYRKLGGPIQLQTAKGQWHNMWRGFFECQDLVDFVIRHARGSADSTE